MGNFVIPESENIFNNLNFGALTNSFIGVLKNSIEVFWEQDIDIIPRAINNYRDLRDESLIEHYDFFSSQIKVDNHRPVIIRLSDAFVESFLTLVLQYDRSLFSLSKITQLEVQILNNYCEFLYKRLLDILNPVKAVKLSEKSDKYVNILFSIKPKKYDEISNVMISLPLDRLNLKYLEKKPVFKDEDFLTSSTNVRIKIGSSKIKLLDLQGLQSDDIVLLENSEPSKSYLVSGDFETKFNVKVNPSLILDLNNEEGENISEQINDEVNMDKNLWDDIQVEINAEFEKVKMSIGELKQITEGQVVDLGSIFESEISLYVENKKVGTGELIIINDRYAVKLNKVLSSKPSAVPPAPAKPAAKPAMKPQQQPAPAVKPKAPEAKGVKKQAEQSEDFDYSDFEK